MIIGQIETQPEEVSQAEEVSREILEKLGFLLDEVSGTDHLQLIMAGFVAVIVIIGSAAFSAAIAESKKRSRNFHFILGLFFPIIYPMFAYALLPRRKFTRKDEAAAESVRIDGSAPPVEGPGVLKAQEDDGIPAMIDPSNLGAGFGQTTFKSLMVDSTGKPRGPFILDVDEIELRAERILDATPDVVVLETMNADGKQQTIRLPYARISACREI